MNSISNTPALRIETPASQSPLSDPVDQASGKQDTSPHYQTPTAHGKRKITVRDKLDLVMAVRSGRRNEVERLLHKGVNIRKEYYLKYQDSPLKTAVNHRRIKILELLLEHGANPDDHAVGVKTPLNSILKEKPISIKVMKVLLKHGANPDAKTKGRYTPLFWAVYHRHINAVKLLLQHGADTNSRSSGYETPLYKAVRLGDIKIAKLLLESGADVNGKSAGLTTPLAIAVHTGGLRSVNLLLDYHADVNSVDGDRIAPLELAAWKKRVDIAFELLRCGARADKKLTRKLVSKVIRKYKINPKTTPLSLKGASLRAIGKHLNGRDPRVLPLPEATRKELRLQRRGTIFP